MPEVKLPLAPDLQYAIDSMTEFGELDSGSATILQLYGDRDLIDKTMNGVSEKQRDEPWTHRVANALTRHAWAVARSELSLAEQGVLLGMGLMHRCHDIGGSARCMAEWAIGDFAEGGYAQSHRVFHSKDGITPSKRNLRRLHAPAWIRRYVKRDTETARLRRLTNSHLLTVGLAPWRHVTFDPDRWSETFAAARQRQRDEEELQWRRLRLRMEAGATFEEALWRDDTPKRPKWKRPKTIKNRRKVALRSVRMAEAVLGTESTRAFMRGNLIIPGRDIDFKVKPRGSVARAGHGAMEVAVLEKEKGLELASLCLYYKNTPAIEQAVSLSLEVQAGDEMEVLKTANITSVTPHGVDHPVIIERQALRALREEFGGGVIPPYDLTEQAYRTLRNDTYWEKTRWVWTDALRMQVFGRAIDKIISQRIVESDRITT